MPNTSDVCVLTGNWCSEGERKVLVLQLPNKFMEDSTKYCIGTDCL